MAFRFAWCLTACAAAVAGPAAAQQPFTLEQVLAAPFPSGLTASPSGGVFAWVQNAEGVRNVWVAVAPDPRGRQLTAYTDDDGQELTDLSWTADEAALVYVRGGAPNRQGEIPNPTSLALGVERAIWVVPVAGGPPRRLVEGSGPAVRPTGSEVAFVRGGSIWLVGLAEGAEPTRVVNPRGAPRELRWSPDGTRLAFTSSRGDHAFVGIFDPASGLLRYLDPSVDRDGDPLWSPDGRRIAFLRVPNDRDRLPFAPRRAGRPWSIRVADPATGASREIWRAAEGPGSVLWGVEAERQLLWAAGDRIVFPWERDGWLHLYAVAASGGEARLLTPGAFEVEHVALTPDGRSVIYSSNQDDTDRRHLWRVSVERGAPGQLTSGSGIEWAPAAGAAGAVAFVASDARTPAHVEVLRDGRRTALAPEGPAADFPSRHLVEPRQVVFPAADGMMIHGQLFLPPNAGEGRHPAVLFFHGGSRRQMFLGFHNRGYYHNAYAMNQYLANRGYVVLSVNYRSGIGYGMEFREALNYGARGASEFQDVLGAGLYLRSRPDVDPARIGLWGGSYGGYLTALGLARASDLFAAGVDLHGVHDWNVVIRNFVPAYDAGARAEVARLAYASSPMASLDTWRSPVLLIHADDDRNVPFSETVDLAESLRARGVEFEQVIFADDVHGFLLHRNWLAAYAAAADFFDRKLGAGAGRP